jgi:transposase-like protein
MDAHLGYEKYAPECNNSGNSRKGKYPKKIQTQYRKSVIEVAQERRGEFEPTAVSKHQSRGLSIEKPIISFYAKGMSVLDIE